MSALATKCLGICTVGQHIKKTGYVMLQHAYDKAHGWYVQVEPLFKSISNDEMEKNGLSIVLDNMRNIPDADSSKVISYFEEAAKKVMSKLNRNHVFVRLELLSKEHEEIKMMPLHAGRGFARQDVRAEEVRIFPLPMANQTFMTHLGEALEIAS